MDDCREAIITWLASIDVVIGMNCFILDFSTQYLFGTICYNFISVHIWLCAWACLPDDQWKMLI